MSAWAKVFALGTVCLLLSVSAVADSMPPMLSSDTPYSSLGFVRGASLTSATMQTASAGTLTVKLTDLTWPQALGTLSFSLSNSTSPLFNTSGPGVWTWQLNTPTLLYASVYASATGAKNTGLYSLNISFVPSALPEQAPVPLPAAGWMLLSGVMALFAARRKHTDVTQAVFTHGKLPRLVVSS